MKKTVIITGAVFVVFIAITYYLSGGMGVSGGMGGGMMPGGMMSKMAKSVGLIIIDEKSLPEAGSKAAKLYRDTCSSCHDLPDPASHDPWQWVFVVDRMEERIKAMGRMMGKGMMGEGMGRGRGMMDIPWDGEIKEAVLGYLQVHAFEGMDPGSLPDSPEGGAKIFKERCATCHTLPDPSMHGPEVWEYVVGKMQQFQMEMDIPVMSDREAAEVLRYLRANSH